jgi:hypothetical protein
VPGADDTEATLAGEVQYGGIVGYFVEYEVSAVPAPVITTTAPAQNNATSIRVDGTADANISVALYNGTQLVSATTSDANGKWHIDAIALTDGTDYSFSAIASIGGYVSAPSNVLAFHDDQTPPSVTIDSETLSNGRVTLSGTITEPSNSISVYDGNFLLGTTAADSNGVWIFTTAKISNSVHATKWLPRTLPATPETVSTRRY